MEYYQMLGLEREPFSNSPDPGLFYRSSQHLQCLQKLEIAVRLRRGLNVVKGDVGTGKTTLCRQLLRNLSDDDSIRAHLLLDPYFAEPREFLEVLYSSLAGTYPDPELSEWRLKEEIKALLYRLGLDEQLMVVLIIDEGQKITEECLEILRELLNYETNSFKLLQIVIFAQNELNDLLEKYPNFVDRINFHFQLGPLDFKDTRALIEHRIRYVSPQDAPKKLFSRAALYLIYRITDGYPRKIMHLCHKTMLNMIVDNTHRAGPLLVWRTKRTDSFKSGRALRWAPSVAVACLAVVTLAFIFRDQIPGLAQKAAQEVTRVSAEAGVVQFAVSDEAAKSAPAINELGTLSLDRPLSVHDLSGLVYGSNAPEIVAEVMEANPDIEDAQTVLEAGREIVLPARPAAASASVYRSIRLELARDADPTALLAHLPADSGKGSAVRLLPFSDMDGNVVFSVIWPEVFTSEAKAVAALRDLPENMRDGARIIRGAAPQTTFYATL
jgi:type II secretory pathway predicted ATPase ExeA/phage tail protein X